MPWVVKLYLLGLFLSVLSALLGLVAFLGDLMPLQDLDPCLSGQWTACKASSSGPTDFEGEIRAGKATGSFS